ncbi:MAG: hypothetical protein V7K53_04190 [Nostoc sp.]|uniref:hypothetical protein n=1 Tax=Nostoc sp. TaxID=1180 RepID=UPI002FF8DD2D
MIKKLGFLPFNLRLSDRKYLWHGRYQFSLITAVSQPGRETGSAIALEEKLVIPLHKLNN